MDSETIATLEQITKALKGLVSEIKKVNNRLALLETSQKDVLSKFGQSMQDYLTQLTKTQLIIQNKINEIQVKDDIRLEKLLKAINEIYTDTKS